MHTVRRLSVWLHTLLVNDDNGDYGRLTNCSSQFPSLVIIARWECVRYRPTNCTYHTYHTTPYLSVTDRNVLFQMDRQTDTWPLDTALASLARRRAVKISYQIVHISTRCLYYTAAVSSERNYSVVRRLCSADRLRNTAYSFAWSFTRG